MNLKALLIEFSATFCVTLVVAAAEWVNYQDSRKQSALSGLLPRFTAGHQISQRQIEGGYTSSPYYYSSGEVNLYQRIIDFSGWKYVQVAKEELEASRFRTMADQQSIIYWVMDAYYRAVAADRKLAVAEQNLQLSHQLLGSWRQSARNARAAEYAVEVARLDSLGAHQLLEAARTEVEQSRVALIERIGLEHLQLTALADDLAFQPYTTEQGDELDLAMHNRPDYAAQLAEISAGKAGVAVAYGAMLPDLSLSSRYGHLTQRNAVDYERSEWNVGLSLEIPLFNGLRNRAGLQSARSQLAMTEHYTTDLRQQIEYEVESGLLRVSEAEQQVRLSSTKVGQAALNYDLAQREFTAGGCGPLEVVLQKEHLLSAQQDHIRRLLDHKLAVAQLRLATGSLE